MLCNLLCWRKRSQKVSKLRLRFASVPKSQKNNFACVDRTMIVDDHCDIINDDEGGAAPMRLFCAVIGMCRREADDRMDDRNRCYRIMRYKNVTSLYRTCLRWKELLPCM